MKCGRQQIRTKQKQRKIDIHSCLLSMWEIRTYKTKVPPKSERRSKSKKGKKPPEKEKKAYIVWDDNNMKFSNKETNICLMEDHKDNDKCFHYYK